MSLYCPRLSADFHRNIRTPTDHRLLVNSLLAPITRGGQIQVELDFAHALEVTQGAFFVANLRTRPTRKAGPFQNAKLRAVGVHSKLGNRITPHAENLLFEGRSNVHQARIVAHY